MSELMSVEDCLPDSTETVLGYGLHEEGWGSFVFAYNCGGKMIEENCPDSEIEITHWQHLPEPPSDD
ncbi:DUF551 domain-containing protein [Carnimonas bestiolae]|uniref:DUF551 domain-containing protein n=1 Tax=Carnimonas bestiolae TaxID=3402172 RepID=UPI003EDC1D70